MSLSAIVSPTSSVPARFHISDKLKESAKGTVATAVEVLGIAATATQNVPYLGIISSVLAEVLKIYGEVDAYKSDWKAVADIARQIKSIVDEMRTKCVEILDRRDDALPEAISKPFNTLENCLVKVLDLLNECMPSTSTDAKAAGFTKKVKGFGRDILNRRDLSNKVKQCREDMQAALNLFNTRLQIGQSLMMLRLIALIENWGRQSALPAAPPCVLISSIPPPSPPNIFHGRTLEVNQIIDQLGETPARVAIIGPGGIGKTSIAQVVLHHINVESRYSERRYFLDCAAITTAEGVVQGLLNIFQLEYDPKRGMTPQDFITFHLRAFPDGLLCLDNFETPWDMEVQEVESLLARITSLSHIALIVTSRGGDRPMQVAWTKPFLPPILPFSSSAALDTWDDICGSHDVYADKLILAVDCVPLAVVLLANLAQVETAENLWMRWERSKNTKLLRRRGPETRLNSVEASIQLSLEGPRLNEDHDALKLLGVLSILPQGMLLSRTPIFVEAFSESLPDLLSRLDLLKQCSLAYVSEDSHYLRVLSPIRHYMLVHPTSGALVSPLITIYCDLLLGFSSRDFSAEVQFVKTNIQPELGNITNILKHCLSDDALVSERTLRAITKFAAFCHVLSIYDIPGPLLSEAVTRAGDTVSAVTARLWFTRGQCLYYQDGHVSAASSALSTAHAMYRSLGDQHKEAECMQTLGDISRRLGQTDKAESQLNSALQLYQTLSDDRGQVETWQKISELYDWMGRSKDMGPVLERALEKAIEIDDRLLKAHVMRGLGEWYANPEIGRYDDAEKTLQSARILYNESGDNLGQAHALKSLGSLYTKWKRPVDAESPLKDAIEAYQEIKNRSGEASARIALGVVYGLLKRPEDSHAAFVVAHTLAGSIADKLLQGNAMCYMGVMHVQNAEFVDAEGCFKQALELFAQAHQPNNVGLVQNYLNIVQQAMLPQPITASASPTESDADASTHPTPTSEEE